LIVLGVVLTTVSARIQVPLAPVPITMQTFAVLLIGAAYGAARGGTAMIAYVIAGACGLPVFALGAGTAYLLGPTGGYLAGFVIAAVTVGALAERGWDRTILRTLAAMTIGTACIFVPGLLWLAWWSGSAMTAVETGLIPHLPGSAVKILLAAGALPFAWHLVGAPGKRNVA
jgi:biotin transport system substrate-specific component